MTVLQHGDSFFPSGGIAFSWGLETLHADGLLSGSADIELFICGQLIHRWATCDRIALARTYEAAHDLDRVAACDAELETLALARELREGSRRTGATLLRVHSQLGTPQADAYREKVRDGLADGHLAAVQGLLWRGVGLSLEEAQVTSAHTLSLGVLGAAIRLGIIGHIDAQKILLAAHATIDNLLKVVVDDELSSFVPASEIAMMRHEVGQSRLFAN
ncbi:MAG: urease accessory UreF family protein [Burkholderiales bacterium]